MAALSGAPFRLALLRCLAFGRGTEWCSMQLLPLQDVASQIKPGSALAWGIRDANGKLLLARGNRVADAEMLQQLLSRGMFVDADEYRSHSAGRAAQTPKEGFFGRWRLLSARLNTLLTLAPPDMLGALDEVTTVVMALADRYPDMVLFQILRHDHSRLRSYGVSHSLHCAAVSCLGAKRMGWTERQRRTLVSAALTANLSMVELQGRLAAQTAPLTPEQRADIRSHPLRSAESLRAAGVKDELWLSAVEQHHECVDGSGYPKGCTEVSEFAQVIHYVDIFTAKLSVRSARGALPPNLAARELFTRSAGHPLAATIIKEFGIYPPGCFVRLESGEIAIVIHRGESVNTPVVACLTRPNGQPLAQPQRRDTAQKNSSIAALVTDTDVMVRVPWESLYHDD
jgi:HD-GYP domain-containing protein (c-di-GMP phosphodiesterase class II)